MLRVTTDAQQANDEAPFVFYPTPALRELVPDSGDAGSDGKGALVRVLLDEAHAGANGTGFGNGSDYRCRAQPHGPLEDPPAPALACAA
jgi:hypothetical protein